MHGHSKRADGSALLLVMALGAQIAHAQTDEARGFHASSSDVLFVKPNDPRISYSEYVNATVDATRARFERTTIMWRVNMHSPGTRVNFRSNAFRVRMLVDYLQTSVIKGSGTFRLEVDGRLAPEGLGSDTATGRNWYTIFEGPYAGGRDFSLILPAGSDVDFLGLELTGGRHELLSPPTRPAFLYVAYGDSIVQGFSASSIAEGYPHRIGETQGWRTLNMGFGGRETVASDGTAVGDLAGNILSIAMGINDFLGENEGPTPGPLFQTRYDGLLDNLRAVQPTVPVFAMTPTWTKFEGIPNSVGLTVEGYRQLIRDVVSQRSDPNLYLVEGLTLVPPGLTYFPDGLHPNDAGYELLASSLIAVFESVLPDSAPGPGRHRPTARVAGLSWTSAAPDRMDREAGRLVRWQQTLRPRGLDPVQVLSALVVAPPDGRAWELPRSAPGDGRLLLQTIVVESTEPNR